MPKRTDIISPFDGKYEEPFYYLFWNVLLPVGTFCVGLVIIYVTS